MKKVTEKPLTTPTAEGPVYQLLKRQSIRIGKTNPRKHFEPEAMDALASNILEHGVLQPLLVRVVLPKYTLHAPDLVNKTWCLLDDGGKPAKTGTEKECREFAGKDGLETFYELVVGERRWRAAGIAELAEVPCMVRKMTDAQVLEVQYIENLQREDLSVMEEAEGYAALIQSGLFTRDSLAERLNVKRSTIFGRLKLLKLSKPVQTALREGWLDVSIAGLIAQVPDPIKQAAALKDALEGPDRWNVGPMTFKDFAEHLAKEYRIDLKNAPFDVKDATLCPSAGACEACPKRTGNMKEEYPDLKSPNVCTDTACFGNKKEAHYKRVEAAAVKNGQKILSEKEYERVRYSSQFVNLEDDGDYVGGNHKKWSAILKGSDVKPMLARSKDDGLIEIMPRAEAVAAAKKLGIKVGYSDSSGGDSRGRNEAKARKELKRVNRLVVRQVGEAMRAGMAKTSGAKLWRFIADCLARRVSWEDSPRVMEYLTGKELEKGSDANDLAEKEFTKRKTEAELREASLAALTMHDAVSQWTGEFSDDFEAAAELCGIDLKKEAKAFEKPKEKPAKKSSGGGRLKGS